MNNKEIYDFLQVKGVTHLHHANTVATSLTFIKAGGLLSRGAVESKGLFQTSQSSDDDDKFHKVWNDIFFDTKDLHGHFPRQNLYGPVLFKFNLSVILQEGIEIYITKNNPMFWSKEIKEEDKYFNDIDDLKKNWDNYELQRKMITIRNDIVAFKGLENIILDDPNVTIFGDTDLLKHGLSGIKEELIKQSINVQSILQVRICNSCFCQSNYLNQYGSIKLAKFFLPVTHARFTNIK